MNKLTVQELKRLIPGLQFNVSLKNYTSFRIGGRAKYFYTAKNKKDLIKAILAAKKISLPFFILGRGSNLLVADKEFKGLAVKIQNSKFKIQNSKIAAEAGTLLAELVSASAKTGLSGLEWAVGVPGTVGGAIYGNAGAFGSSMKDIIRSVQVLDVQDFQFSKKSQIPKTKFKIKKIKNRDCQFGYRDSVFKKNKNQSTKQSFGLGRAHKIMCSDLIILSAELQLKKGNKNKIKEKMKEYLNYRKETQPLDFPSAGSVFRNPSPTQISSKFMAGRGFSAGELIEKCGLKGKRIGGAKISEKHNNFIVNLGKAKARDVLELINLIKQKVKKKFGMTLEEEIEYLGFEN